MPATRCAVPSAGLSDVEAWRDAVPVLMLLTNPSHAPLLAALMRERRSAPREIACLAMRCTQHGSAWLAVAPPAEVTTLQWRQLLGYAFNALHAAALMPFALAFARGCEGPDLLRAMAGALGALPRKAPAGQAPVDHATTQCFAVVVALKLLEVAYYDPAGRGTACPPVGLTPVEALLLWCDVELAATAVLSAATEYGGAALQAHADTLSHGLGPRDTWSMAIAAWDLSAIMTCAWEVGRGVLPSALGRMPGVRDRATMAWAGVNQRPPAVSPLPCAQAWCMPTPKTR